MSNDEGIVEAADGDIGALTVLGLIGRLAIPSTLACLKRHQLKGDMIYWAYSQYCGGDLIDFLGDLCDSDFGDKVREHFAQNQ